MEHSQEEKEKLIDNMSKSLAKILAKVAYFLIKGLVVFSLFNAILVPTFSIKEINYSMALGIIILVNLLFKKNKTTTDGGTRRK